MMCDSANDSGDTMPAKLLAAIALGLLTSVTYGAPVAASSEEPSGFHQIPLRYIDANGKFVGRVLSPHAQSPSAVMRVGGALVAVPISPYQSETGADFFKADFRFDALFYSTPDCTGTAYLSIGDVGELLFAGIRIAAVVHTPGDGIAVMLGASGRLEQIQTKSVRYPQSDCQTSNWTASMFQLSPELFDITGQFKPPFSIR